jgi:CheY-like chemotaxis protein/HPt (histidine-containing phosphotransfer) domain-containing protein
VRLVELVLPPAPHEPPAVARLDGEHLLVVGPTARSARVFADMARSVGLVASRAHDLPGLRATSSGPPFDAVLVDGAFPGGLRAVVGATRDWKVRPPLLVAAAGDDDARAALHQGADGILGKPVLPSKLAGALARLIRGHGAPAPRVSSRRALLVEDEPLNARLAERVLRKVGCSVVHAGDGKTALDVLARESFDVVFLDLGLPGLDGIGVARRLRQTEGARRVPIIAVTAAAPDVAAFAAAGIDGYLGKPLHEGAVRQTLERVEAKPASTPSVSLDERAGPTSDGPVLDLAELLCRANGDTAFVAEILADLDAEARGLLAATADAAREGGEALARAAHRLRGALLAVGARHAARLAADVELAARSPGTDAIADRVAALRDAVDAARAAARRQATSSG